MERIDRFREADAEKEQKLVRLRFEKEKKELEELTLNPEINHYQLNGTRTPVHLRGDNSHFFEKLAAVKRNQDKQKREEEVQECTFNPRTSVSSQVSRNLKETVENLLQWQKSKNLRLITAMNSSQQPSFKPEINEKSKKITVVRFNTGWSKNFSSTAAFQIDGIQRNKRPRNHSFNKGRDQRLLHS